MCVPLMFWRRRRSTHLILGTDMFLGILTVDADAVVVACDALTVAFAVELEAFALDALAG